MWLNAVCNEKTAHNEIIELLFITPRSDNHWIKFIKQPYFHLIFPTKTTSVATEIPKEKPYFK